MVSRLATVIPDDSENIKDPGPDPDAPYGHSYKSLRLVAEGEELAPAFAAGTPVQVSDFMRPA